MAPRTLEFGSGLCFLLKRSLQVKTGPQQEEKGGGGGKDVCFPRARGTQGGSQLDRLVDYTSLSGGAEGLKRRQGRDWRAREGRWDRWKHWACG